MSIKLSEEKYKELKKLASQEHKKLNIENNDLVLIISGKYNIVKTSLGALRCKLARDLNLINKYQLGI